MSELSVSWPFRGGVRVSRGAFDSSVGKSIRMSVEGSDERFEARLVRVEETADGDGLVVTVDAPDEVMRVLRSAAGPSESGYVWWRDDEVEG